MHWHPHPKHDMSYDGLCTCQFHAPPPPPHARGGWGNTGDLRNRGVKFPTTGAKSAVTSPPP